MELPKPPRALHFLRGQELTVYLAVLLMAALAFAQERNIEAAEVPAPVLAAIHKRYPDAKLTAFSAELKAGKKEYEVRVEKARLVTELTLNAEGTLLSEERVVTGAEVPLPLQRAFAASRYSAGVVRRVERCETFDGAATVTFEFLVTLNRARYEIVFSSDGTMIHEELTTER